MMLYRRDENIRFRITGLHASSAGGVEIYTLSHRNRQF